MKYEEARKKPRVFQQLTGMTTEEFDKLKGAFEAAYEEEERQRGKPGSTAGRKAVLRTSEDKLFFLLFYLRHYPVQEVLAFLFGISQGQANHWIHRLTPVLKKALAAAKELPGRTADEVKGRMRKCPKRAFIIDGTDPYPAYCLFSAREAMTVESLLGAIQQFELRESRFSAAATRANALRFSAERFKAQFRACVEEQVTQPAPVDRAVG